MLRIPNKLETLTLSFVLEFDEVLLILFKAQCVGECILYDSRVTALVRQHVCFTRYVDKARFRFVSVGASTFSHPLTK